MGGPPATLMSAICPSGTKDRPLAVAPGVTSGPAAGNGIPPPTPRDGIAPPPPIGAMSPRPPDGMSVAELGPFGRRGLAKFEPAPGDAPPPIPSMFWARKIGFGQPSAPAAANALLAGGVSRAPCVPIGLALPPPIDPLLLPPLPPPIGTSTWRSDSRLLRR